MAAAGAPGLEAQGPPLAHHLPTYRFMGLPKICPGSISHQLPDTIGPLLPKQGTIAQLREAKYPCAI